MERLLRSLGMNIKKELKIKSILKIRATMKIAFVKKQVSRAYCI
jgi:hypothetical protein